MSESMTERVKRIMAKVLRVPVASIGDDASPDDIPSWDSLRNMNLVLAIEEEFGVELSDQDISEMRTVRLITLVVEGKLQS